jgi:hypothetical protein
MSTMVVTLTTRIAVILLAIRSKKLSKSHTSVAVNCPQHSKYMKNLCAAGPSPAAEQPAILRDDPQEADEAVIPDTQSYEDEEEEEAALQSTQVADSEEFFSQEPSTARKGKKRRKNRNKNQKLNKKQRLQATQ